MNYDINILLEQEKKLQFDSFTADDALDLGLLIIESARELSEKGVAVSIVVNGLELFRHFMDGTNADNITAIRRKSNVTIKSGNSSFLTKLLIAEGELPGDDYADESNYMLMGGSFPIYLEGGEMIGFVCVSNLEDFADHQLVASAIAEYLGIKIQKVSQFTAAFGE